MLPPAVAVQPDPTVLDPPPPAPPAKAGAGRGAVPPAEPAGLLEGEEAVAGAVDGGDGGDEDESEAGVLGVPKPPPLLPPRAVAI